MSNHKIQAFISYRRATGREVARNIYERLSLNGINTFFDYNSMRNGKFNDQIYDAIEQASDFILILSKSALDRCASEDDWVRIEIEHALRHGKNIIIVSTESEITFPDNLPESLSELPSYHGMTLNQEYYEEGISRLIGMLSCNNAKKKLSTKYTFQQRIFSKRGIISLVIIIFIILAIAFSGKFHFMSKSGNPAYSATNGLVANLYLPRYSDLDREVLDNPWFSNHESKDFVYIDTIIDNKYHIFPHSSYFTDEVENTIGILQGKTPFYHNLPLRLSVKNTKSDTQVINEAELEVMEIHPISTPLISIYDKFDSIQIVSPKQSFLPGCKLFYSLLASGESFNSYKEEKDIIESSLNIPFDSNDSIMGKISFGGQSWKFAYKKRARESHKESVFIPEDNKRISKIAPSSSNVKVFNIEIGSLEAPEQYRLENFSRQIVKGEVDDDLYLVIKSSMSFDAKVRIKLTTVTNKTVYSEPVIIQYLNLAHYDNQPF